MKFEAGKIYHLYNRGNNSQKIFFERDNYIFFLQKIRTHLKPVADIMAYCLMPNHFHLLVYVPEESKGLQKTHQVASSHLMGEVNSDVISKPIRGAVAVILRLYTQAINKKFNRTGSLFQSRTKAKDTEDYTFECFHYIHQNPMRSKLVDKLDEWEFSSFLDYSGIRNGTLCNKKLAYELLEISSEPDKFIDQSYAVIPDSFTGWLQASQ